jgi:hypothetical protein
MYYLVFDVIVVVEIETPTRFIIGMIVGFKTCR